MTPKLKDKLDRIVFCADCGKPMEKVKDPIAKKVTGYLYKCKCFPNKIISVG